MSKRDIKLLLEDILDAAGKIIAYTDGMNFDEFLKDNKTIDAVIRNFEVIGEAASRIPQDYKSNHPEIEWRRISGFRNRIIHDYFGIDYKIVWKIKKENIPGLMNYMEKAIKELQESGR